MSEQKAGEALVKHGDTAVMIQDLGDRMGQDGSDLDQ